MKYAFYGEQIPKEQRGELNEKVLYLIDSGNAEVFAYVKINGETVLTAPMQITSYGSWDTGLITGIEYTEGDTITVGISVKCQGSGNGAWGKIDDALLNKNI